MSDQLQNWSGWFVVCGDARLEERNGFVELRTEHGIRIEPGEVQEPPPVDPEDPFSFAPFTPSPYCEFAPGLILWPPVETAPEVRVLGRTLEDFVAWVNQHDRCPTGRTLAPPSTYLPSSS